MTLFRRRIQVAYALDTPRDYWFDHMETMDLAAAYIIEEIFKDDDQFWVQLARFS
jgi:hypothetical protein